MKSGLFHMGTISSIKQYFSVTIKLSLPYSTVEHTWMLMVMFLQEPMVYGFARLTEVHDTASVIYLPAYQFYGKGMAGEYVWMAFSGTCHLLEDLIWNT